MISEYQKFLEEQRILPLDNWISFIADHSKPRLSEVRKQPHIEHIKNLATDYPGVYIYYYENTCLYIGEASNLGKRIVQHYDESWKENQTGRNYKQFPFFKQYRKELKIYSYVIENDFDRKIIEGMLTRILQPTYIDFRLTN
ncbi:GIY-YIG nuclease family protein [Niallia alba]|uniref:GIY-YIG nuclease family protein n=1 Tax=Niallia alba TaxID=2729105 RepID=UPI0039A20453